MRSLAYEEGDETSAYEAAVVLELLSGDDPPGLGDIIPARRAADTNLIKAFGPPSCARKLPDMSRLSVIAGIALFAALNHGTMHKQQIPPAIC
jgi:hypothetical protein